MPAAKINGTVVHDQAISNPGINNWMALHYDEQFTKEFKRENSIIVKYNGIINYGEERTNGKGKAKFYISKGFSI